MVYNCGYPVNHTFLTNGVGSISYDILIGTQIVYSGEILPFDPTATTVTIDISAVCRAYLETFYEDINFAGITSALVPVHGLKSTVITFLVSSVNNTAGDDVTQVPYTVIYDYNTDYIITRDDVGNRNNPLLLEADPRQYLFIGGYAATGSTSYSWAKNSGAGTTFNSLGTRYQVLAVRLNSEGVNAQEGDTITLAQSGGLARFEYKVIKPCRNRFALYYVNKMGGLDSLLCSGRYIKRWNPDRTDVRLYDDRTSRRDFQQTRLYQEIAHRWELNTGWLDDDKAENIDELINTPKCWIHDLEQDTITSCLIVNTGYDATRFNLNDIPAQYTINVEESQLHERQ